MQALLRSISLVLLLLFALTSDWARAQSEAQPPANQGPQSAPSGGQYSSIEVIDAGHRFFGTVSRGLAQIVEKAGSQWGLPNGYVLGQEAGGAMVAGLRYGEGIL